jgi:hypothetical protein
VYLHGHGGVNFEWSSENYQKKRFEALPFLWGQSKECYCSANEYSDVCLRKMWCWCVLLWGRTRT